MSIIEALFNKNPKTVAALAETASGKIPAAVFAEWQNAAGGSPDEGGGKEEASLEVAAQGNDWWDTLSRNEQLEYVHNHPHTHRKVTKLRAGNNAQVKIKQPPRQQDNKPLPQSSDAPKKAPEQEMDPAAAYKDFAAINEYLRGDRSPAAGSDAENEALIKKLDRLIASHTLKEDVVAYRGYGEADITKALHDPAYLSTSRSEQVAREHAGGNGYIARIIIPAGTHAFEYTDDHQQEIVLPRLTRLHMRGVDHERKIYNLSLKPKPTRHEPASFSKYTEQSSADDRYLRTAIKTDKGIYAGHQGELHSLLEKRSGAASKVDGFLNHKHQFLDRQAAVKYAADNGMMPKKHSKLISSQGGMISDVLPDRRFKDTVIHTASEFYK